MPDFTKAAVKQSLEKALCDDCGVWSAVQDGQVPLTNTLAQMWWVYGRVASELRIDLELAGASVGDQVRVEVWQQPQNAAGGGILVWSGTLTIPNGSNPNTWFTIGAARGPYGDAWGWRARLVGPVIAGATGRRLRGRLVGQCSDGTLGTLIRGEGVAP